MRRLAMVVLIGAVFTAGAGAVRQVEGNTANVGTAVSFSDLGEHWAASSVLDAAGKGYVNGYPDGTFRPDQAVSRAEFIKLVASALTAKVPGEGTSIEWFMPYVDYLKEIKVLSRDFFTDDMNQPMLRAEMGPIAAKAANVNSEASMLSAVKMGLINGVGNGELAPMNETTRAQAVTVIGRILSVRGGVKLPVDHSAIFKAQIEQTGTNTELVLGVKTTENFRKTHTPVKGMEVTYDQVIFIDPLDATNPYLSMFDVERRGPVKGDEQGKCCVPASLDEVVIVAIHQTVRLTDEMDPLTSWHRIQSFYIYDTAGLVIFKNPADIIPPLFRKSLGSEYRGWVASYRLKSHIIRNGVNLNMAETPITLVSPRG